MGNNIFLNSLLIKNLQIKQNKSVLLKPLDELLGKHHSGINIKDSLVQKISQAPILMNPLLLFSNEKAVNNYKSGQQYPKTLPENIILHGFTNSGNMTIIEPGSSPESINAIKQIPGRQWLGKLPSNGNRETAVIIPDGVDYNKPFELIYYFHGHDGSISKAIADPNYGFKDQVKNLAKDKNIILVVPQGPPTKLDYTWMNGKNNEDMQQFENDTINIIKTKLDPSAKISSITVKGHSAGGRPIMNSAVEGKLTADRIDFMDASYGNWASQAYNSLITKNPDAKFNLIYIPGSQTQSDALGLQGKTGVSLIKSNVGHSYVPKQFFSI